jgi:type IV secretion system protein VirD4
MFTKNKVQISTYMVLLIPFVLLGIFASGLFSFPDLTLMNIGDKVMYLLYHIWEYKRFFNEKTMMCIGWSVILWVFLCSYIMYHFRDFHSDIQNGSEEWADPYEVTKRRANPDDSLNRIISKNVKISTQGEGAPSNNNMVVVGSSGKYKTTSIVISNTLNSSANQITLDVKGEIMYKLGLYITKIQHKTIRCLNLKYPQLSDRYNPFAYIECEEDIINLIENIYDSLTPPDAMVNDPFWPEGAKLYLQSLFYYEWWYAKKEGRKGSINNILILINDETKKDTTIKVQKGQQPPSYLQLKMDKLAKEDSPDNPAVRDYRKLKDGAAETVRSIIIIVNAKLKLFETAALKRIFEDDDMNLREFGTGVGGTLENPTNNRLVLFICVDDREKSFHFIASMLYTQVLTILCRMADDDFKENGGALPIPLEMLLDEFYAGAKPSNTVELMGVIRSRNISMIPILQSTSQLKDLFKAEKAEIIYDNVPVLCFCGAGQGAIESHKYISELLGKTTIDTIGDGKHGSSYNSSYNKAGRELMTPQEVKRMDKKHCIIFMEDEYPIYDRKALPWEDKGASRKEIRRCKRLYRKNPNIQIPSRKSKYQIAMELNKASKDKGYVPAPKSMIDPHTGIYVTINSNPPIEETSELPDNALVIDMTSEEFLYQKLGDNDTEDDITAAVSEEIKRLYELDRQSKQQMKKPARKTIKKATENVTDSVTSAGVPATIEDGVVMYFDSFTEEQKELINKAIVKKMPDIFIRQMFTMKYNDMKEFFDSYYNE